MKNKMSMSRLPLMVLSAVFLAVGNVPKVYYVILGLILIAMSLSIWFKKMFPHNLEDAFSLLGLGTMAIFFGGLLVGISLILGSYVLPGIGMIGIESIYLIGLVGIFMGTVEFTVEKVKK